MQGDTTRQIDKVCGTQDDPPVDDDVVLGSSIIVGRASDDCHTVRSQCFVMTKQMVLSVKTSCRTLKSELVEPKTQDASADFQRNLGACTLSI